MKKTMDQQNCQRMIDKAFHEFRLEFFETMKKCESASVVNVDYATVSGSLPKYPGFLTSHLQYHNAMAMDHAAAGPLGRDSGYGLEGANHLATSCVGPVKESNFMNTHENAPHSYHDSALISSSNSSDDSVLSTTSATSGGVSKASQLKRSFIVASGHSVSGRKLTGEHDPENREIKRLRQDQNLGFDDIANELNQKRVSVGTAPDLTANAVYSRYKRNAPLIAAMDGEDFQPTELDKKHASIKFKKAPTITGFDAIEDELLVKAHNKIQEDMWSLVSERIMAMGGKYHDPAMCAGRFKSL